MRVRPSLLCFLCAVVCHGLLPAAALALEPTVLVDADPVTYNLMYDLQLAYPLVQPNVSVGLQSQDSLSNANDVFTLLVDLAVVSTPLLNSDALAHPTVAAFPFLATAVVPVYRLDVLAGDSVPLVFSRSVLLGIFTGDITQWDDTRLTALNPAVVLPAVPIIVIVPQPGYDYELAYAFSSALQHFNSSAGFNVSTSPAWPLAAYAAYRQVTSVTSDGLASAVVTTDCSISYASLATALKVEVSVGDMVNAAGSTVSAGTTSINFAVVELGTQSVQSSNAAAGGGAQTASSLWSSTVMDLNDASGSSAWPMCVASFFLLDLQQSLDTCGDRSALVSLLQWVYEAPLLRQLAESRQYSLMPDVVLSVLDLPAELLTSVMCRGEPAVAAVASTSIILAGSYRLSFMLNLLTTVYSNAAASLSSTAASYQWQGGADEVAFDQFINGEVDVALVFNDEIRPELWAEAQTDSQILLLPFIAASTVPIFNPEIVAGLDISQLGITITLEIETLIRVFVMQITQWSDPAILAQNPALAAVLPVNTPSPITLVRSCGPNTPLYDHLSDVFHAYAARYNTSLQPALDAMDALEADSGLDYCLSPEIINGLVWTPYEPTTSSVINAIPGAFGFQQDNEPAGGQYAMEQISVLYPRTTAGVNSLQPSSSSAAGQRACLVDTFQYDTQGSQWTFDADVTNSNQTDCWPFTQPAYLVVRSAYSSSLTDAAGCARGLNALLMVQWLINTPSLSNVTEAENLVLVSFVDSARQAYETALIGALCDDGPLLVSWPTDWQLNSGVRDFVYAFSALGVTYCIFCLVLFLIFKQQPIIRSASPAFLSSSVLGLTLMYLAAILWVSPVNAVTCSAFQWLFELGFFLTFAPLFARTWRIYAIFGRKKLKFVKIGNRKLGVRLALAALVEVSLVAAWQATEPLQPVDTSVYSGSPSTQHLYTQCGLVEPGVALFAFLSASKGVLLVFGAMMAFTTRSVRSSFNESQGIAWAIYNVVFSVAIIVPILLLISAVGDVLVVLLMFLLLWVTSFTLVLLTVRKVATVLGWTSVGGSQDGVSSTASSTQFSPSNFLPIRSQQRMQSYIRAVEQHLKAAQQHLQQLVVDDGLPAKNSARAAVVTPSVSSVSSTLAALDMKSPSRSQAGTPDAPRLSDTVHPIVQKQQLPSARMRQPTLSSNNSAVSVAPAPAATSEPEPQPALTAAFGAVNQQPAGKHRASPSMPEVPNVLSPAAVTLSPGSSGRQLELKTVAASQSNAG